MLFSVAGVTSGMAASACERRSFWYAREILAIIGRNGVGKTTLMKTIIGSIAPMGGRIDLAGQNITHLRSAGRARLGIGYVPQGRAIFTRMSVADNLILGKGVGADSGPPNFERVYRFFRSSSNGCSSWPDR